MHSTSEGLTEEALAIFDLLTKPAPVLTKAEETKVKQVPASCWSGSRTS